MSLPKQHSFDLKTRVITCLNKLSDRDTSSIATIELESIAKSLCNHAFASFLTCLSSVDSSHKSPVRRQCVRLLSVLSAAHGDALSPHLSKILSSIICRLRDSDSAIRSACIDAVSSIASHITGPPFSSISRPLMDCLSHEQNYNSQNGASLCLAAAIEAAPEPEDSELKRMLPRLLKLVKNDGFKAKPALLSLIGSIASAGGASGRNALINFVPTVVEFLSSEEWQARKAAAEALGKLALAESYSLSELKLSCLASLENRRFDKVKIVRDTMNRAIELWKQVPGVSDETESNSSCKDFVSSGCGFMPPHLQKISPKSHSTTGSSSSTSSNKNSSPLTSDPGKPKAARSFQMELQKPFDLKVEAAVPQNPSSRITSEYQKTRNLGISDRANSESCRNPLLETRHWLSARTSADNFRAFGGARHTRVVPLSENPGHVLRTADGTASDTTRNQEEFENFTLIQKQICQIENQQSSLLDLLQRFIGHSHEGMDFLESRVNGLEKALDEMSSDLAISDRRLSGADAAGNGCCILPGADFLHPKLWRKTEEQSSCSKTRFNGRVQSLNCSPNKDLNFISKSDGPINNHQTGSEAALNSTGHRRIRETGPDAHNLQTRYVYGLDRASLE